MNYIEHLNQYRIARMQNSLSTNAIALYFIILEFNNSLGWIETFTVANSVLMGLSDLSRDSFNRARNELKQKGFIEYENGSGNQAGKYLIVSFATQAAHKPHTTRTQPAHTTRTLTKQNKTKLNKEPPISPKGELWQSRFKTFWAAYPKKAGKGKAEEWFKKKGPSAELLEIMIAAIGVQHQSDQWQKCSGQFIPHPTTWLNQERWRDTTEADALGQAKDGDIDEDGRTFVNGRWLLI